MMNKILLVMLCFFICNLYAETNAVCNDANSNVSGIPEASCSIVLSTFYIGAVEGYFFVDTDSYVTYEGKSYRLRLSVTDSNKHYNDFQAILQTAYASRSILAIIYPNGEVAGVGNANLGVSDLECRLIDNPAYMYCPIRSVYLSY